MNAHTPTFASPRQRQSGPRRAVRLLARYSSLKALIPVGVLAAAVVATSVAHAGPRQQAQSMGGPAFDGAWSIVIQTERGACDSYRIGVDIVHGAITYDGTAYGRVNANGAVRVAGSMGDQKAEGTGRLSRASGQGAWRAASKLGPCSGHWTAERRG